MKKAVLIINPSSGDEKAMEYKDKFISKAKEYFDEVIVKETEKENDATKFASEAADDKCEAVFAFGGDGTVNEVIAGISEKEYIPKLGIIPGGTVNLMSRLVGEDQNPEKAIDELDFERTEKVDIGKCNDKFFGYIFSIGSVPEAIHNVETEEKTKFGPLAYFVNSMKSVVNDTEFEIEIETDNGDFKGSASHVIVLLTNWLGDKKIFSRNKDGYANILILKDSSILSKFSLLPDFLKGELTQNDKIEFMRAKKIHISSPEDIDTDIDGDEGDKLPVDIEIFEQRVEVYSQNN